MKWTALAVNKGGTARHCLVPLGTSFLFKQGRSNEKADAGAIHVHQRRLLLARLPAQPLAALVDDSIEHVTI